MGLHFHEKPKTAFGFFSKGSAVAGAGRIDWPLYLHDASIT
jgi:hypothetical protein